MHSAGALLSFGIGGPTQGNNANGAGYYGNLNVSGSVVVGGALNVALTNGYVPPSTASILPAYPYFNLLTVAGNYGSGRTAPPIVGSFGNVANGGYLPSTNNAALFQVFYGPNGTSLSGQYYGWALRSTA